MLAALTKWTIGNPRRVVAAMAAVTAVTLALGAGVARQLDPFSVADPDTQSSVVKQQLERASGVSPEFGVVALVALPGGIDATESRARVREVALELRHDPAVAQVITYYAARTPAMVARDKRSTVVLANLRPLSDRAQAAAGRRLMRAFADDRDVRLGSTAIGFAQVQDLVMSDLRRAELLAAPILFLLAIWLFRGVVAALVPMAVAGVTVAIAYALLRIVGELVPLSVFVLNLVAGLGLGLAIDYSLLIVSRFREELAERGPGAPAVRATLATAGRTVLFSSLTVAAALAALLVFPQRFLYSMGVGGAIVALAAGAVALLLCPALLMLLGRRVDALGGRWLRAAAARDASMTHNGAWYRLSRRLMRRPVIGAVLGATLVLVLAAPFMRAQFTAIDGGALPTSQSTRVVHDALIEDFARNRSLPVMVMTRTRDASRLADLRARIGELPGVATVEQPLPVGADAALVRVATIDKPLAPASQAVVRRVRALGSPHEVAVGGMAAEFVDYKDSVVRHMPAALGLIVVTTFVLVLLMTGSAVLPLKVVLLNLLTVCAAGGVLVWIFQNGRLEGLLDYASPGALEATQPVVLFAIVFGLATDYGVMMLARIAEFRQRGEANTEAVARGLQRTGRVITSAALLLGTAVALFATSSIVFIKEVGLGVALAVAIDTTLVRALLMPSLMALLGEWNWWAPNWIRRRLGPGLNIAPDEAASRGEAA